MRKILLFFSAWMVVISVKGQMPDTSCFNAGVFCFQEDIEGIIWQPADTIPGMPSLPYPINLCSDGGQPNNILYFNFVANSNTVTIQINALSCDQGYTPTDIGYQWGVYTDCNEIYSIMPENLICQAFSGSNEGNVGMTQGSSDQFVPGQTYVLFVDGFGGSMCDFTVNFVEGLSTYNNPFTVDEPTHFTNSLGDVIFFGDTLDFCTNGYFTTTLHGADNAAAYLWSIQSVDGTENYLPSNADTLWYKFTQADSIYKVCSQGITDCDESEQQCFYVKIETDPKDSLGTFTYCQADLAMCVIPPGWEGPELCAAGTYYHTVTDTLQGCTHLQEVKIVASQASIEDLESVFCGMDTIFFNGDTITEAFFEKQYFFAGGSANGCDSILNYRMTRFYLDGEIGDIKCLGNNLFGLEISLTDMLPSTPDSLKVIWFRNNQPYKTGATNVLQLVLTETGSYSATVILYQNGLSCMFDLAESNIDQFITASYSFSSDSICQSDYITVVLDNYDPNANYQWVNADLVTEIMPGTYQLRWNQPGDYDLQLKVDFESCQLISPGMNIYVEKNLDIPVINCVASSNDTIHVAWSVVDCAENYELWLDGNYVTTVNTTEYIFYGLEEGKTYQIELFALSSCLCPSSSSVTSCITDNCPDDVVLSFDQLPFGICVDEFLGDTLLSASVSGTQGGQLSWDGSIITNEGLIAHSKVDPGSYPITLQYALNGCLYEITDTFRIFPEVAYDLEVQDISCYYSVDGSMSVSPMSGSSPFTLYLEGEIVNELYRDDLNEGSYSFLLEDGNGCEQNGVFEIFRPEKPLIEIVGSTFVERGQSYDYELSISNLTYDSVIWYIPSLDTILCSGQCDLISYAPMSDLELCLELYFDGSCRMDTCIDLRVNKDVSIFIPNIFTPGNRDGLNDYFMIVSNAYESIRVVHFEVFDRWGGLMFSKSGDLINGSTPDNYGWDGTINGQDAMAGVYVYLIELEDSQGNLMQFAGDVTLIR